MDSLTNGLAAGTLVTTPDGDKKIEDVKAGDSVLSGVGRGDTLFYKVEKAMSKQYNGPLLRIETESGQQLRATPNHICFALSDGDKFKADSIRIAAFDGFLPSDNYINHGVGKDDFGYVSHTSLDSAEETSMIIARAEGGLEIERSAGFLDYSAYESFPEVELRFRPAAELRCGMKFPIVIERTKSQSTTFRDVRQTTITNITEEQYDGLVYDLDIPEARNFAANGVLVHDSRW